jgi:hypothetical protein
MPSEYIIRYWKENFCLGYCMDGKAPNYYMQKLIKCWNLVCSVGCSVITAGSRLCTSAGWLWHLLQFDVSVQVFVCGLFNNTQ